MCVSVVHGVVAVLAERYHVLWFPCKLRIMLNRKDVVNVITLTQLPVSLALLAHVAVPPKDGLPDTFPFFRSIDHNGTKKETAGRTVSSQLKKEYQWCTCRIRSR